MLQHHISRIFFTVILSFIFVQLFSQEYTNIESQYYIPKGEYRLSISDSIKLSNLPELIPPKDYIQHKTILPAVWDNSTLQYFRPLFNDVAFECGQASGIALGFNYELNFLRGTDASLTQNQIPTHFVYNFQNAGGTTIGVSYFDSWEVLRELGSPTVDEYGGMHVGTSSTRNIVWVDGYDTYYEGMHNRADRLYSLYVGDVEGLDILKGWLYNHLGASTEGGIANFYSKFTSNSTMNILPAGTPEAGRYVISSWGYSNHGMTIVGWNDSIRYDVNGDGQYTKDIDINSDGVVDLKDWEIGGLRFANTYANANNSWGNDGFAYMLYSTLALPYGSGGIWNNSVHIFTAKEDCDPLLTMKIDVKHNVREQLRFSVGISEDTTATEPDEVFNFNTFNGKGGDFFMQGGTNPADEYLEFGLDISRLLTYATSGNYYKFFLITEEIDPYNSGVGRLDSLSLIDYTNGIEEVMCNSTNVNLLDNDETVLTVVKQVNFSKPDIVTSLLPPAVVNAPFSNQLEAIGGTEPYVWELMYDHTEIIEIDNYVPVNNQMIYTNGVDNGWAVKALEFEFPFYGDKFDSIYIYNDGYILFAYEDFRWNYARSNSLLFKLHRLISPFLADLSVSTSGGYGIYYVGDANSATFRWHATVDGLSSDVVDFSVTLYPDGKIDFHYGEVDLPQELEWYGGISSGDGRNYTIHSRSNEQTLPSDEIVKLIPRNYPEGLSLSPEGYLSGTVSESYPPTQIKVRVSDNNDIYNESEITFFTDGFSGLTLNDYVIHGGSDELVHFGENVILDFELLSLDSVTITNANLYIEIQDPFIELLDSIEEIGDVLPSSTIGLNSAISFNVSPLIPDGNTVIINGQILADNDTSEFQIETLVYSPKFNVESVTVIDGNNNIAEAGESMDLIVGIKNVGGAKASDIMIDITTMDPYVTINSITDYITVLESNQEGEASFNVFVASNCPVGHVVNFIFQISIAGIQGWNANGNIQIGQKIEDWEVPGGQFEWSMGGDLNWSSTSSVFYEGSNSLRSGAITHNQESYFYLTADFLSDGYISFYYKVSCEDDLNNDNYDYLQFSIDDVEVERWDGEVPWTIASYFVMAGTHTVKWNYHKDVSVNTGDDRAWIDLITFPQINLPYGPLNLAINSAQIDLCEGDSSQLVSFPDGGSGNYLYSWTPTNGLNDPNIANPYASPLVSTEYILELSDGFDNVLDSFSLVVNPIPATPVITGNGDVLLSSEMYGNQWYASPGIFTGGISQEFIPDSSGNYYVVVENEFGCVSEPSDIFSFNHSSIIEIENSEFITTSPNPFTNDITISINIDNSEIVSIDIISLDGRKVKSVLKASLIYSGQNNYYWDGNNNSGNKISSGIYFVKVIIGKNTITEKIIKF